MTDARRTILFNFLAAAVLAVGHGGLIVGLALAGEWRVWRFITDFIAQLDALIVIAVFVWLAITHRSPSRVLRERRP